MADKNNTPKTVKQEDDLQIKLTKALIEDDIFKLEYEMIFAYIDTINNIRKKISKRLEDEFVYEFKYKHDITESKRLTNIIVEFRRSDDYISMEDINKVLDTLSEIFKEEGIEQLKFEQKGLFGFKENLPF
ncbi:MAG: hypothetical protein ACP5OJ_06390 [Methanothermobacter sp.]